MLKPNQKRIDKGMWWDRAWSLVEGCGPVSPACKNCWSARATFMREKQDNIAITLRYQGLISSWSDPPAFNGDIRLMHDDLNKPTPRQKPAVWSVWNDLFHNAVPFNFTYKAFERMLFCPRHFFIVCTKRVELMAAMTDIVYFHLARNYPGVKLPLKNVMAMTTVESQDYERRVDQLLRADFAYRGLSVEPMLSELDIYHYLYPLTNGPSSTRPAIDFVACGPETGPGARPCDPKWIEDLYEQCRDAGVAFFDKRKTGWIAREFPNG